MDAEVEDDGTVGEIGFAGEDMDEEHSTTVRGAVVNTAIAIISGAVSIVTTRFITTLRPLTPLKKSGM